MLCPFPQVALVQAGSLHRSNSSKVVPLLIRLLAAQPVPNKLRQYRIFRGSDEGGDRQALFQNDSFGLASPQLRLIVGVVLNGKDIELVAGSEMDQVEGSAMPQRLGGRLGVNVKLTLEILRQRHRMPLPDGRDNIDVSGRTLNAVDRTGERTRQEIANALPVQRLLQALERLGNQSHQVGQAGSQP